MRRGGGGGWGECETLSVATCWFTLEEIFIPHVLVIPFGILEILMGGNREEMNHRMKLRIGMTGNIGGGAPALNALAETIEGFIGGRTLER